MARLRDMGFISGKAGRFHGPLSRLGARRPGLSLGPSFTLDVAKSYFFTAQDWSKIMEPAEKRAMNRSGALYRKQMRWFLGRRRKKASRPGQTPTKWTGLLQKHVYYAFDPSTVSVIVGPIYLPNPHKKVYTYPARTIPELLEHGGHERVGYDRFTPGGRYIEKNTVVTIQERPYVRKTLKHPKTNQLVREAWEDLFGRTPESLVIAASLRPAPSKAA